MLFIKILLICHIFFVIVSANKTSPIIIDIENKSFEIITRIVGGKPVDIKTYPFLVSIQWRYGSKHHCGGSYVLPRFILSAAHCMIRYSGHQWYAENPRFYLVLAGTSNLWYSPTWQIGSTDAVIPHPKFNYGTMANDIGFFRITKPFRLTPYVNYAPIPFAYDQDLFMTNKSTCTVIGWGKTSVSSTGTSDTLQYVNVPLISKQDCDRYFTRNLHDSQVCAGKKEGGVDACQGDSGGPLVCNEIQIAIVSWGYSCAAPNSPGVYCRVDNYLHWIKQVVLKNASRTNDTLLNVLLIGLTLTASKIC